MDNNKAGVINKRCFELFQSTTEKATAPHINHNGYTTKEVLFFVLRMKNRLINAGSTKNGFVFSMNAFHNSKISGYPP